MIYRQHWFTPLHFYRRNWWLEPATGAGYSSHTSSSLARGMTAGAQGRELGVEALARATSSGGSSRNLGVESLTQSLSASR